MIERGSAGAALATATELAFAFNAVVRAMVAAVDVAAVGRVEVLSDTQCGPGSHPATENGDRENGCIQSTELASQLHLKQDLPLKSSPVPCVWVCVA